MSGRFGISRPGRPGRQRGAGPVGPRSDNRPGGLPDGPFLAPGLAGVGLFVVALVTLALFTRSIPLPGIGSGNGVVPNGSSGPGRTPTPSNVVIVDPRANIPGTLVYVKDGNLWIQTGSKAVQITTSGQGSMPSWSPDGQWIYYIESYHDVGYFQQGTNPASHYTMDYPVLTRIHPDGTGAEKVLSGRYRTGPYTWFFWIRQPRVSPDGKTVALVSDGTDPTASDVVLQLYSVASGKLKKAGLPETPPLGHQDPAWRPDGKVLLYVKNGRDATRGTPTIYRYDLTTKKTSVVSQPGYMQPAWSPDGHWIAVTHTSNLGTDVAILNAQTGSEVLRLTNDDSSWAPVWSPRGDAIAYLHLSGQVVDVRMIGLAGTAPTWTVKQLPDVTLNAGLDGGSPPSWYVPAGQLPSPSPSPAPSGSGSPGASPSGSVRP